MICPNCKKSHGCGCQKRVASNGVSVCSSCITTYEQSLKNEIQHIFDSGANEIRILEMVKSFIEKRGQALYIHDVSNSAEYTRGYRDGWRDCCKDVKEFG